MREKGLEDKRTEGETVTQWHANMILVALGLIWFELLLIGHSLGNIEKVLR